MPPSGASELHHPHEAIPITITNMDHRVRVQLPNMIIQSNYRETRGNTEIRGDTPYNAWVAHGYRLPPELRVPPERRSEFRVPRPMEQGDVLLDEPPPVYGNVGRDVLIPTPEGERAEGGEGVGEGITVGVMNEEENGPHAEIRGEAADAGHNEELNNRSRVNGQADEIGQGYRQATVEDADEDGSSSDESGVSIPNQAEAERRGRRHHEAELRRARRRVDAERRERLRAQGRGELPPDYQQDSRAAVPVAERGGIGAPIPHPRRPFPRPFDARRHVEVFEPTPQRRPDSAARLVEILPQVAETLVAEAEAGSGTAATDARHQPRPTQNPPSTNGAPPEYQEIGVPEVGAPETVRPRHPVSESEPPIHLIGRHRLVNGDNELPEVVVRPAAYQTPAVSILDIVPEEIQDEPNRDLAPVATVTSLHFGIHFHRDREIEQREALFRGTAYRFPGLRIVIDEHLREVRGELRRRRYVHVYFGAWLVRVALATLSAYLLLLLRGRYMSRVVVERAGCVERFLRGTSVARNQGWFQFRGW